MTLQTEKIVRLKAQGYSSFEIAKLVHVTTGSVELILHRIYKQYNCTNFLQFAYRQGWMKVSLPLRNPSDSN